MPDYDDQDYGQGQDGGQESGRPVIALMGEFSAGKSTLLNMLLGRDMLPMQVTATQLPPIWLSFGEGEPYRVDLSGRRHPVNLARMEEVPVADTQHVRVFGQADALQLCDFLDTPGISDPQIPAEVWRRAAEMADGVIWCTHATQAWRQSEAGAWSEIGRGLEPTSLMLVTQMDKMRLPRDRERLMARLRREAGPRFADILGVSLLKARMAGENEDAFRDSGMEAILSGLVDLVERIEAGALHAARRAGHEPAAAPAPEAVFETAPAGAHGSAHGAVSGSAIVPRRVDRSGRGREERAGPSAAL